MKISFGQKIDIIYKHDIVSGGGGTANAHYNNFQKIKNEVVIPSSDKIWGVNNYTIDEYTARELFIGGSHVTRIIQILTGDDMKIRKLQEKLGLKNADTRFDDYPKDEKAPDHVLDITDKNFF